MDNPIKYACILRKNPLVKEEFCEIVHRELKKNMDILLVQDDYYKIKEADSLNNALANLEGQGYGIALIIDADEYMTFPDVLRAVEHMRSTRKDAVTAKLVDYVGIAVAKKIRDHRPVVAIKTSRRFTINRCTSGDIEYLENVTLHHFSLLCSKTKRKLIKHWDESEIPVLKELMSRETIGVNPPDEVVKIIREAKGDICKK